MFGRWYYGARFFGPRYFGVGGSAAPAVHGDYFGDRYFSTAYFGARYFGGVSHSVTPPSPSSAPPGIIWLASLNRLMNKF